MNERRIFTPKTPSAAWTSAAELPSGFMFCPFPALASGPAAVAGAVDLYRLAYERALAAAVPSVYERAIRVCLN